MGEEKQKTEDEELETENGENRARHFLEINKIWFTTIIPLLVSIAVAAGWNCIVLGRYSTGKTNKNGN